MSAGVFVDTKYLASYGAGTAVHPIRCQPETLEASADGTINAPPEGDLTNPISAQVSGGKKRLGLHARTITLESVGDAPEGYKEVSRTKIPCLTADFYTAAIAPGAVITYLTTTWRKAGSSVEVVR